MHSFTTCWLAWKKPSTHLRKTLLYVSLTYLLTSISHAQYGLISRLIRGLAVSTYPFRPLRPLANRKSHEKEWLVRGRNSYQAHADRAKTFFVLSWFVRNVFPWLLLFIRETFSTWYNTYVATRYAIMVVRRQYVRRQYADKGVGIRKRPPPPPKINVNNLIVDDKVKLSEKQKCSKKKSGKKSKSSLPLLGVPRYEASREVLQSREPEPSHRRSSRDRSTGRPERCSPSPQRQRSLPQPPPPKEYAIAPSAMKRAKSLTKTAKPSKNSKPKLFGANEAKKKAVAATSKAKKAAEAQQQAGYTPPKWNQVLYGSKVPPPKWNQVLYGGSKSSCNNSLASTNTRQEKAAVAGQSKTGPTPSSRSSSTISAQKVVRIGAPPGSVQASNTRSIQTKPGLDDKIIMALDNCIGDFDLYMYDFLEDTGERVETMQKYVKDGDESTMPGKAKILYQKSKEKYQESQKHIGEIFERSMKAMADADEGRRPEPEPEPEEMIDGNEDIVQKDGNMDFAVEVTTDTTQTNSNSLEALLKNSEAQGVPAESSTEATTKKKKVDLTPIKNQILSEIKQAKKSASLRLGLYLQGVAKTLINEEAADNLCCSALDSSGLEEEDLSKSTIEKDLEERKNQADNVFSATNEQQQEASITTQDVVPNGKFDESTENVQEAIDTNENNKDVATDTPQDGVIDQTATSIADADNSVAEDGKDESDNICTFSIDQKVSDKVTEEEDSEEAIETSTQRIEGKLRELVQLLDERKVKEVEDVVAVVDEPKETNITEEEEDETISIIEEKEGDREMDKSISNDSRLSF